MSRSQIAGDWREDVLSRVRALITQADPGIVEERKWRKPSNRMAGVPVWSHDGLVCTGETYKGYVKLTFARGAALEDPKRLFNSSLDGRTRRAIDIREGETIDGPALKALIREAVALNAAGKATSATRSRRSPRLLAGDNPQIPKGEGDAPVQAYIAAIPGWKRDVARRLDRLVARAVPRVRKAVKWNTPLYGAGDGGWFLSFHCFTDYVKVAFFRGNALRPVPPVPSKLRDVRYLHVREDEPLDERQLVEWVRQASRLPGERM